MTIAPGTRALTRLAWRELRRRSRRSLLVIALVGLPVAALTVGAVSVASSTASQDGRRSLMGGADALVVLRGTAVGAADVVRDLPAGSRALEVRERYADVPGVRGSDVGVELTDLPIDDPLTAGMTKLLHGRAPVGPGEVAATTNVLRDLGLRVGEQLVSNRLGVRARVTAQIVDPTDIARYRVVAGAPLGQHEGADSETRLLVSLPDGAASTDELRGPGREVIGAAGCCPLGIGNDGRSLGRQAILAISAIALLMVGLVVAAAFAIGARRQLRTIGLLQAAAGADDRHVRRLALLQGALCGGAGVIGGFAAGFAVVAVLGESLADPVTGAVTVPLAVLAAIAAMATAATTVGAWLPGRTAARMPALAALAGRGALRPVARTLPLRGLATSALGTVLMTVALNADNNGVSVVGAVMIALGFVLCAPALVAVLEPLTARAGATTRLAARDIARQRARTGPLVAAILAVASLALLGATVMRAEQARSGNPNDAGIGRDQVLLSVSAASAARGEPVAVPARVRERVRALLPSASEAQLGFDQRPASDGAAIGAHVRVPHRDGTVASEYRGPHSDVALGGPRLLEALGAGAGLTALERGAAVVLRHGLIENGQIAIRLAGPRGEARELRVPASQVRVARPERQLFVSAVLSPKAAARIGLRTTATDVVMRTPRALTADERRATRAEAIAADRTPPAHAGVQIRVAGTPRPSTTSASLARLMVIAGVLILAVVAAGLALSVAEGRSDDTMLVALGAAPATRRRLRATQAAMLVGLGGALAVPAGLIPAAVIILNGNDVRGDPLRYAVPWPTIALVLLALPAAAAAGAWLLTRPGRWSPAASWAD
ncbi:MAG TPA: FtsX-like permease family protein [Solirubrobacteraceae bacterium]|jgi:putative ABC transport system permease protein|nr:FtsX-like permease family protein [Solirubrobacteraceae bacterium]